MSHPLDPNQGMNPTFKTLIQSIPVRDFASNQEVTHINYRDGYDEVCAELAELKAREKPIFIARTEHSQVGEWAALYVDGFMLVSERELTAEAVLDALGIKYKRVVYPDFASQERGFFQYMTDDDITKAVNATLARENGQDTGAAEGGAK